MLQCLGFIEASLLKSDKSHSAAVYFDAKYHYKLASILLSIKQSKFSKRYAARVLRMFSNLLMSRMYALLIASSGCPIRSIRIW